MSSREINAQYATMQSALDRLEQLAASFQAISPLSSVEPQQFGHPSLAGTYAQFATKWGANAKLIANEISDGGRVLSNALLQYSTSDAAVSREAGV